MSLATATALSAGYAAGTLSPVEATQAALAVVDRWNGEVNAVLLTDPEGALASARESEQRWGRGEPLGPADGVPVTIKDMFLTRGWPTVRGSSLIDAEGPWEEDAPAVARLRESGAVVLGKTTTPEFAWKGVTDSARHGVTGNAWGSHLTPGGSSGGSATAVALGMGAWSIGTDGGGSVRIPASFTGTTALKPTFGRMPMYPPSPYGTLSHGGPMTRTVEDAALLLDLVSGPDSRDWAAMPPTGGSFSGALDPDPARALRGLRVALSPTLGFGRNDPEVEEAVERAAADLEAAGAHVARVDPGIEDCVDAFHVLWFTGAAKVIGGYGEGALERVDPGLARAVHQYGLPATASDYLDAMAVRMALGVRMGAFHEEWDVLLTPTTPIAAFAAGRDAPEVWPSELWTSWTPYTYPFNMTQQPALSVPCGFTSDRRPVGLQLVAARHRDDLLLRVGHAYQQLTGWHTETPTLLTGP
ncbi:amidase [Nocardioides sp. GXQ0305]|uniref:amidase n=1 Tax=Nocardioides sp. GXQ0305 TaxID=3423912 RepID=UPI003D7D86DA